MNAMNRSSQIFKKLLVLNGSVLFAMTLQRLVLFLLVVRHWTFGVGGTPIIEAFVAGVRFDLCVLGFMNIPVLLIVWITCTDLMAQSQNPLLKAFRRWTLWLYFGVTTLIIHALAMLDLMFFASNGHRWTIYDYQDKGFDFFASTISRWGVAFSGGIIAFFLLLWVFRSLFILVRIQLHTVDSTEKKQSFGLELTRGVILPIFIVALAARGTWTPHHLNMEHAEVSQIQALNQLALSPVWAFDKKF